jgi:uncharacterized protein (DUF983 family)
VSKVCPSCGSGRFERVDPDAASGAALLNDRVCKDCGTRYTPTPPAALPYFILLIGLGIIAAGANSLYCSARHDLMDNPAFGKEAG